jgi:insertion element IS1 protein InsB
MASTYTNLRTERQYRASTGLSEQTFNQLFEQFKRFYVPICGRRTKKNVIKLLKLLKSFNITCFYTDGWKVYGKLLPKDRHIASKKGTQRVERNNLNFRTRLKRMTRKTICFSKNLAMHKLVIALFINFCSFC